jgi:large subunit ribosomal protein L25
VGAEDAPGVREGGVLSAPAGVLTVEALPMEVPESIEVDVTAMEMGDSLRLEDLPSREGVTYLDDPHETVLATVSAPMREEELEAAAEEAAAEGLGEEEEAAPEEAAEEPVEGEAAAEPAGEGEPGTVEG